MMKRNKSLQIVANSSNTLGHIYIISKVKYNITKDRNNNAKVFIKQRQIKRETEREQTNRKTKNRRT